MIEYHGYNRFNQSPAIQHSDVPIHICHNQCSSLIISSKGELYICGFVNVDNVGNTPTRVLPDVKIITCSIGLDHVVAVSDDGVVYSWGTNKYGQLANGNDDNLSHNADSCTLRIKPVLLEGQRIINVATGDYHTIFLSENGNVYGCGKGIGSNVQLLLPNEEIAIGAKKISCGAQHTAAILLDGRVVTWGWGGYGQLGHGKTDDESKPKVVAVFDKLQKEEEVHVVDIACGSWHTASIMSDGSAYTWGWGGYGQLGLGNDKGTTEPTMVDSIDEDILHVACGSRHTVFASETSWYAFGYNQYGQLGSIEKRRQREEREEREEDYPGGEEDRGREKGRENTTITNRNTTEEVLKEERGEEQRMKEGSKKKGQTVALLPLHREREKKIKKVFAGGWATCILYDE